MQSTIPLAFRFLPPAVSSDVVWESKPKKKSRWKPLSIKEADLLEDAYNAYVESGSVDNLIVDLETNLQVTDRVYTEYIYTALP